MTGRVLNVASGAAIFCFALLCWIAVNSSSATETPATNQPATVTESQVLTNAEQVHWLSRKDAAGQRVLIRGVVTVALPEFKAAVVQDATGGIYFDLWTPPLGAPPPVGEFVEV